MKSEGSRGITPSMRVRDQLLLAIATFTRKHPFRGMQRFLRIIHNPDKRHNDSLDVVIKYDSNLLLRIDTSSFMEWCVLFQGYYELENIKLMKQLLQPDWIVVDVGANVGCYALIMSSYVGKRGIVLAFEPQTTYRQRLFENIELNHLENIKVFPFALADASGQATLYSPSPSESVRTATLWSDQGREAQEEQMVMVKTLDEFFDEQNVGRLDFIKIDTDGGDFKVILGARKSLEKYHPSLLFEYDQRSWDIANVKINEAIEFFKGINYSLYYVQREQLIELKERIPSSVNILALPSHVRMP